MSTAALGARIIGLLRAPRSEWPKIAAEPASIASLYANYIVPVAGFAVACRLLNDLTRGARLGEHAAPGFVEAIGAALQSYVVQLVGVFVVALIIEWLAPSFGGVKDRVAALKLAAYAATASWLANVFLLIPGLGILVLLGLYSLRLFHLGAPAVLGIPQQRAMQFTASFVGIGIVCSLIYFAFIGPLLWHTAPPRDGGPKPSPAPAAESSGKGVSIPGVGRVDISKLNQVGKRLEALTNGDTKLTPIPTVDLVQQMPLSLPGFRRTRLTTSDNSAGLGLGGVTGDYASGENTITLSVSDMGIAGEMAALTGALGVRRTEENPDGYNKLDSTDGQLTMEDFNPDMRTGSYAVLVADRVLIKAEGRGVNMEQLRAAVATIDRSKIEALAAKRAK
jgi:hypothetical protein